MRKVKAAAVMSAPQCQVQEDGVAKNQLDHADVINTRWEQVGDETELRQHPQDGERVDGEVEQSDAEGATQGQLHGGARTPTEDASQTAGMAHEDEPADEVTLPPA